MPTTELPPRIPLAAAARRTQALERAIHRALTAPFPPSPEQRRKLAALLLDGIEK